MRVRTPGTQAATGGLGQSWEGSERTGMPSGGSAHHSRDVWVRSQTGGVVPGSPRGTGDEEGASPAELTGCPSAHGALGVGQLVHRNPGRAGPHRLPSLPHPLPCSQPSNSQHPPCPRPAPGPPSPRPVTTPLRMPLGGVIAVTIIRGKGWGEWSWASGLGFSL